MAKLRIKTVGSLCTRITNAYERINLNTAGLPAALSPAQISKVNNLPLPIDYTATYNLLKAIPPTA